MKRTHSLMCIRTKLYRNYDLILSFVLGRVVGKHTFKLCNLHCSFLQSDISVIENDYKLIWIVLLNWRYLAVDWDVFCMYVLLFDVLILKVKYVLVLFKSCGYLALLGKKLHKNTLLYTLVAYSGACIPRDFYLLKCCVRFQFLIHIK